MEKFTTSYSFPRGTYNIAEAIVRLLDQPSTYFDRRQQTYTSYHREDVFYFEEAIRLGYPYEMIRKC